MLDMSVTSTLLVFIMTVLIAWIAMTISKRRQLPPGPFPLPVLGNILTMIFTGNSYLKFNLKMADTYGKMYMLHLGYLRVLFLNDVKLVHEAFVKNAHVLSDRPRDEVMFWHMYYKRLGKGLFLNDGPGYRELRRVSVTAMKDFGVGKKSLEEKIMEETSIVLDVIGQRDGQPAYYKPLLRMASSNVICNVIFGSRFDHDDPTFVELLKRNEYAFSKNPITLPINFWPVLRHIPFFMKRANEIMDYAASVHNYVKFLTQDHESTFDANNLRDFVDIMIDNRRRNQGDRHWFSEVEMRGVIHDLFAAGSDTTGNALYWALLYMASHQQEQRRCQEEIDKVVGRARSVTSADQTNMKYLEATILETLRMGVVASASLPHKVAQDTYIDGYFVPQGTLVQININNICRDARLWPEPSLFKPEHFLDDQVNVVNRENLLLFSVGPRSCIGESLAKMELFLLFTSILQNYNVQPGSADREVDLEPFEGMTTQGKEQDLILTSR